MPQITITDLARILSECAGEGEGVDLGGGYADVSFEELGYDSLAVLETAGRLKRDYGVDLTDEEVAEADTPRMLLGLAQQRISASTP